MAILAIPDDIHWVHSRFKHAIQVWKNHSSAQPRWRSSPQEPSRCRRYQTPRRLCYLCWRPQEELRKKRTWRTRWVSGKSQFFAPGNQRCRKIAHNIQDVPLKTTIYSGFLFAMFDDTGEENIYRSPLGDRTVVYHCPSRIFTIFLWLAIVLMLTLLENHDQNCLQFDACLD